VPLTEHGRDEARRLAPLVRSHRIGAAFVSPSRRARETAELIGVRDARVDADLREWDYGGYEGVTTAEIQRTRPGWFLFSDGVAPGPPEHPGESVAQVGARADRMLAKVDAAFDGAEGTVLLVAHGHFLRVLTARRLGLEPSAGALFQLATGTVCRLGTEHDRPVIAGWNLRAAEPSV
jgi:probable phosphoglycerate mutase